MKERCEMDLSEEKQPRRKDIDISFKKLVITCEDNKTHIVADGEELGHGTIGVYFSHDTERCKNTIRLHTKVNLIQE